MDEKRNLINRIRYCETGVCIRWGFGWKGAEWVSTTKDKLIAVLESGNYAHYDVYDVGGKLGISFYSACDMT